MKNCIIWGKFERQLRQDHESKYRIYRHVFIECSIFFYNVSLLTDVWVSAVGSAFT